MKDVEIGKWYYFTDGGERLGKALCIVISDPHAVFRCNGGEWCFSRDDNRIIAEVPPQYEPRWYKPWTW